VKIAVEGIDLRVHVEGSPDAPVLVLLHAFPLHGGMWSAQVKALADRWRVIVPDFRGFGGSDVGQGQYAIDFFADDLFAILDAPTLGVAQPIVACGLSMGGYVLLRAVEREPDRFRALILADTRSGADNDEARLKRLGAVRTMKEKGAAGYADVFADGALGPATKSNRPEVVQQVKEIVRGNPVVGMIGAQLAMASRTDTTAALPKIKVPTLVVVGADDALTPPDASKQMAAQIPGARLEILPGVGHLPPLEAPDAFNQALKPFLNGLKTDR
jgi:3-oxoadipate enol-lactonase